jgi:lipid II:glycine glycyltransferase (peptidoglycan interpeptide bridge formation enzyme)
MNEQPTICEIHDPVAWDRAIESLPGANLLQSHGWGELKSRYGWEPVRLALLEKQRVTAAAQMLLRSLPGGLMSMAYVPRGPLVDPADGQRLKALLVALAERARAGRAIFLRVEPPWLNDTTVPDTLMVCDFQPTAQTVQPRRTILVDLNPSEDDLLVTMNAKTRYNIRLAGRKDVEVWEGTAAAIPDWYALMKETARRQRFSIHSLAYYQDVWACLAPVRSLKFFLAYYEGELLAGIMVGVFAGVATYLYGASSGRHRDRMPNYLLQWEAMRWAKAQGCVTYDLWGIPDEDEETLEMQFTQRGDGMWGVYRFKRGFGGRNVRYVGAFDQVLSRPMYHLWNAAMARLQPATG